MSNTCNWILRAKLYFDDIAEEFVKELKKMKGQKTVPTVKIEETDHGTYVEASGSCAWNLDASRTTECLKKLSRGRVKIEVFAKDCAVFDKAKVVSDTHQEKLYVYDGGNVMIHDYAPEIKDFGVFSI